MPNGTTSDTLKDEERFCWSALCPSGHIPTSGRQREALIEPRLHDEERDPRDSLSLTVERLAEPLEAYLGYFDEVRATVENLLEMTVDLSQITESAVDVLTDPDLLEAVR